MKLVQQVKIAHSFLHVMSKLFHPIISACLGSSTSDGINIFQNSPLKLKKWLVFYVQSFSTNNESWFEHTAELLSIA